MKNKTEKKLDEEFERLGVKPRIYHFTEGVVPFSAITIVVNSMLSWNEMKKMMDNLFQPEHKSWCWFSPATGLLKRLRKECIYGVAICDRRDQFNRERGRIIAKGRMLKHLNKRKHELLEKERGSK